MDYAGMASEIHQNARNKGFWDKERDMAEMLMLAISELSEALEENRDGKPLVYYMHFTPCVYSLYNGEDERPKPPNCSCTPKPEGFVIELADCMIRCLDTMQDCYPDIPFMVKTVKDVAKATELPARESAALYRITQILCRVYDEGSGISVYNLTKAMLMCEKLIERFGWSAPDAMRIKMAFNETRAHMHGKAY